MSTLVFEFYPVWLVESLLQNMVNVNLRWFVVYIIESLLEIWMWTWAELGNLLNYAVENAWMLATGYWNVIKLGLDQVFIWMRLPDFYEPKQNYFNEVFFWIRPLFL